MKLALLSTALLTGATAFNLHPSPQPRTHRNPLRMSDYDDSYPSDSSEDTHFTVAAESTIEVSPKPPSAAESTVSSLMDFLPPTIVSSSPLSAPDRAAINESILKLEALNPTPDPVRSPLLNGVWTLRYAPRDLANFSLGAVAGGYSPGLLALGLARKLPAGLVELGELEVSISRGQPRIEARVGVRVLGGAEEEVVVRATLEEDSGVRFTETYEGATVLGQSVEIPEALRYSRDLYVSYVDEEVLVVRDESGVPEILVRK